MEPTLAVVVQSLAAALGIGIVASALPAFAVARRPLAFGVKAE